MPTGPITVEMLHRAPTEPAVTPIRQALYAGDRAQALALVEAGTEPNAFDAAALGDSARLAALLESGPALVHEWSADGFTALHFAAYLGGPEVVRMLLDAGGDVVAVACNGMRVNAGPDANARQQSDYTPLDEAVITENEPLAALLRAHGGELSGNQLPT